VGLLRKVFYGLLIALAALVLIAYLLPRKVHVERAVQIASPPEVVFVLVNSFKRYNEYSPWYDLDPNAAYTYSGPESGVGARMAWVSQDPSVGTGAQEIVASERPRLVRTRLDFDAGQADAMWTIVPVDGGSQVTWAFDSDLGLNPVTRYMGLLIDRFVGKDYEKGLAKLRQVAEATSPAGATAAPVSPDVAAATAP